MNMTDNQNLAEIPEVRESLVNLATALEKFRTSFFFNPGDENCVHEWTVENRPYPQNPEYGTVRMRICKICGKEEMTEGSTINTPGGEGYSGAVVTVDKNGDWLGYLEI